MKHEPRARLAWTLLVILLVGLAAGESTGSSSVSAKATRVAKNLELEDLNSAPLGSSISRGTADSQPIKRAAVEASAKSSATTQTRIGRQNAKKPQPKPRPGFLWTLASVTYETFNDTRSAIQQLGQIVSDSLAPEPKKSPPRKKPTGVKKPTTASASLQGKNGTTTTAAPETTTEFKLTRSQVQSLVRRNVKGLVRLFNIEWRDAIDQSKKNAAEFRRDLGKQVGIFLRDNPNVY